MDTIIPITRCPQCEGAGGLDAQGKRPWATQVESVCPTCGGSGRVQKVEHNFYDMGNHGDGEQQV